MTAMKKVATILLGMLLGVGAMAQTSTTTSSVTLPSTAVAANCPAPAVGSTNYCFAADKLQVSANGAAYAVIWPAAGAVAGVTSVQVGTGAPQTGAVVLPNIPSVASTTVTVAAPPLSVTSTGQLAVGAPTATAQTTIK